MEKAFAAQEPVKKEVLLLLTAFDQELLLRLTLLEELLKEMDRNESTSENYPS